MTNEKRDKLAKEYVDSGMLNSNHPHEFYSFCDGYDQGYSACAAEKDAKKSFNKEHFYELMQSYRHTPLEDFKKLQKAYDDVLDYLNESQLKDAYAFASATHVSIPHETLEELNKERDELKAEIESLKKEDDRNVMRIHGQSEIMADLEKERDELKAEVERLTKLHDMDALIMDGLRRVLATSRMALNGNTLPLELALKDYDKHPLPSCGGEVLDQWREQAEALYAVLEHAHAVGYIGDRGSTAKWCKEVLAAFEAFKKGKE